MSTVRVLVPADRVLRWFANFEDRHGAASYTVVDGALSGDAADGSSVLARAPFGRRLTGTPVPDALVAAAVPPPSWGVLLVRKGGFAVARLAGPDLVLHKVGQRHVQGRTKAGGQSQQRFARRRQNQAREAYGAAADHAARVLGESALDALVVGGDRTAVDAVLEDARLAAHARARTSPWLAVADPNRSVLDEAVLDACAVEVTVTNA